MPRTATNPNIDRSSPEPLHRQLKLILQNQIDSGEIGIKQKLPSERNLVAEYGVSRITVRQAINAMIQEGYVQSHPGKGVYVTERRSSYELHLLKSFTATAIAQGRVPGSQLIKGSIGPCEPRIAKALQLAEDAPILYLKRIRSIDGDPVVLQEDWLAPAMVPGLLELDWTTQNRSLYRELKTRYGIDPICGQTVLGVRIASDQECQLLQMTGPAALLTLSQVAFDDRNRPVNVSFILQDPNRYEVTLYQNKE